MTGAVTPIPEPPTVASGHITAMRLFDVAFAIDLARVEALWADQARPGGRVRLSATPHKAISFGDPPLDLVLEPVPLALGAHQVTAAASARLHAFGVITLALRIAADGLAWSQFSNLANATHAGVGMEGKRQFGKL